MACGTRDTSRLIYKLFMRPMFRNITSWWTLNDGEVFQVPPQVACGKAEIDSSSGSAYILYGSAVTLKGRQTLFIVKTYANNITVKYSVFINH